MGFCSRRLILWQGVMYSSRRPKGVDFGVSPAHWQVWSYSHGRTLVVARKGQGSVETAIAIWEGEGSRELKAGSITSFSVVMPLTTFGSFC